MWIEMYLVWRSPSPSRPHHDLASSNFRWNTLDFNCHKQLSLNHNQSIDPHYWQPGWPGRQIHAHGDACRWWFQIKMINTVIAWANVQFPQFFLCHKIITDSMSYYNLIWKVRSFNVHRRQCNFVNSMIEIEALFLRRQVGYLVVHSKHIGKGFIHTASTL